MTAVERTMDDRWMERWIDTYCRKTDKERKMMDCLIVSVIY